MRLAWTVAPEALRERIQAKKQVPFRSPEAELPPYLESFLAHLRLLVGVPFEYLIPDERLLPVESIRFFYLDRSWADRLVDGVMAVGKIGTREQAHHQAHDPAVQARLDNTEWHVRDLQRGKKPWEATRGAVAPAQVVTGFVVRSAAVKGWPHMEVQAFDRVLKAYPSPAERDEARIPTLRLERLSPTILIALFAGVPKLVWIEEPHHGVQLGVKHQAGRTFVYRRDRQGQPADKRVAVPFRRGNRRVVHAAKLRDRLAKAAEPPNPDNMPEQDGSAAFAIELLDVPWRQRFQNEGGVPEVTGTGAFASEFAVAAMALKDRVAGSVISGLSQ
jgi:hypothetical protein